MKSKRAGSLLSYSNAEILDTIAKFQTELHHHFEPTRSNVKKFITTGRILRSSNATDFDDDNDAFELRTTSRRRLSRYTFEDMIKCGAGESFMMYVAKYLDSQFDGMFGASSRVQQDYGLVGGAQRISSRDFYVIRVTITSCNQHDDIMSGFTTLPMLKDQFKQKGGFVITLDKTGCMSDDEKDITMPLPWSKIIEDADEFLFFGKPHDRTRPYYRCFRNKNTFEYLHHIFLQLSMETRGDAIQSSQLFSAYNRRRNEVYEDMLRKRDAQLADVIPAVVNVDAEGDFYDDFNDLCKKAFTRCVSEYNDYTQPIISVCSFNDFFKKIPSIVPSQWAHLCGLRGIDVTSNKYKFDVDCPKLRQIFFQILLLKRMINPQKLVFWAMIQTVAYLSWGVGRTATNATSYFGISVSSSARDKNTFELINNNEQRHHNLLKRSKASLCCYDNVQKGQHLLYQLVDIHQLS